jgi:DNA-binding response OmpR family regulator
MAKKILVADDNRNDLLLIQTHLEENGFEVILAKNGEEVLDKTMDQLPDLLLLDVKMPKLDGDQVYNFLRSNRKTQHLPILIMTGLCDQDDIGGQSHQEDTFAKPIDFPKLICRIKVLLKA